MILPDTKDDADEVFAGDWIFQQNGSKPHPSLKSGMESNDFTKAVALERCKTWLTVCLIVMNIIHITSLQPFPRLLKSEFLC